MAVIRTLLPRKGIIQPRHGDNYEADLDHNWLIIDSALQDANDVRAAIVPFTVAQWLQDTNVSGVVSGFALSSSPTLAPGLSPGVLYAQGARYSPSSPSPHLQPQVLSDTSGTIASVGSTTPLTQQPRMSETHCLAPSPRI